ncbi:MAG: TetR family transcriptional regulator [Betaproteobacteria bacterium]|nr:TetR family transcriptional regulator [Betaproteobacteria bacterium]
MNISPGNLYYHFRNKDEIIHHLFADFEKAIDVAPSDIIDAGNAMEDLWLYLHLMFEKIWAYRFLYRNLDDLTARDSKLKSHFNIIIGHKRQAMVGFCNALVNVKAMQASEVEIAALTENVLVVASYWLNYVHLKMRKGQDENPEESLTRGIFQVMSLLLPYLQGEARAHLTHLMKNYIRTPL